MQCYPLYHKKEALYVEKFTEKASVASFKITN